jgi:hypothetical protein
LVDLWGEPECPFSIATAFLSFVTSHNPLTRERVPGLKMFTFPRTTVPLNAAAIVLLFAAATLSRTITTILPRIISTTRPCTTIPLLTGRYTEVRMPPRTAAAKQPKTCKWNEAMEDSPLDSRYTKIGRASVEGIA